ncbi:GNAT family N-acetyltransferase [Sphingobacterium alkalisoli]|uniref:GNAT family N-acetyltransferase n=1 Tax=Sphingobacterium alkalisoli TaxID=1874115 RepID=A0A4U0H7S5_9SPHI|nr:GNAT family N-acetyltransferase [Sphingobacterium alkalisoli]TJY67768.1 GNAT family N-acetyltransferase [Sphingobacterium alkalisoli]GGH11507.1 N-acetyltransferase [Sphingobacterium alkalisoli]
MFTIRMAATEDVLTIHQLAHQIYPSTYKDVLSQEQIDFMLENIYGILALKKSMLDGQEFYLLFDEDGGAMGFIALLEQKNEISPLRIEKLYLLPETQGKGCGTLLIDFATNEAIERGKTILELNVNRGNKAYHFYLKQGFLVTQQVDIPYYKYILDDFVMQKDCSLLTRKRTI